ALRFTERVIVTSPATARLLIEDFAVPRTKVSVVQPGTDRARPVVRESEQPAVRLLSVGAVVARKGYDVLVGALAQVRNLSWTLLIVGDRERSPDVARMLDAQIAQLGFGDRITFTGALPADRLGPHYAAADLFVLPSRFEGYGM